MQDMVHCEGGEWGNKEEAVTAHLMGWGCYGCCERCCAGALVVSVSGILVLVAAIVVCHGHHCHHGGSGRVSHSIVTGKVP